MRMHRHWDELVQNLVRVRAPFSRYNLARWRLIILDVIDNNMVVTLRSAALQQDHSVLVILASFAKATFLRRIRSLWPTT